LWVDLDNKADKNVRAPDHLFNGLWINLRSARLLTISNMQIAASAIFWDHDGLLVETELLFYTVTQELLAQEGIEITQQFWSEEYLSKGRSTSAIVTELGLAGPQIERLIEERNRRYYRLLEQQPPIVPHALEVLREVKRRFPMAMVTGNTRKAIDLVHRSSGVLDLFDTVITYEDFPRAKPFPDSYLGAARRLAVDPTQGVAIEDSERGLAAALAAGMKCIVVPGMLTRTQRFLGAAAVVKAIETIPSLLVNWGGSPNAE
jgi:HAD superfamily hydrolase (TIGR01509 family)